MVDSSEGLRRIIITGRADCHSIKVTQMKTITMTMTMTMIMTMTGCGR